MARKNILAALKGFAAVSVATLALATSGAQAATVNYDITETSIFTPVYGKTLAPIGYVNFCARNAGECRAMGGKVRKVVLTRKNWQILHEVNNYVNKTITPVTDNDLYQVPEYWTFPKNAGDCEDYVLQKKRYLEGLGFPAETLLISVVLDQNGGGHAVLTVRTDRGDFALDNMRDDIRRWNATGYTFIKRQSQQNPNLWVSLTKRGKKVTLTTAAGKD
jgi:predicted transglutaminase-like cysteine proteinase